MIGKRRRKRQFIPDLKDGVPLARFGWDVGSVDIGSAPFLFYDEHGTGVSDGTRLARRAEIGIRVRGIAPNTLLLVRLMGEEHVRVSTRQELVAPCLANHRFTYSALVNTDRYLGPLLAKAIGGECDVLVSWGASSGPVFRIFPPTSPVREAPLLDLVGSTPFNMLKAIADADDAEGGALGQFIDGKIERCPSEVSSKTI
ncbi:hypothetical protein HFO56_33630 [Rhizobium laguerreae]|uniref:hypothetical protein n=1 Tax=Rhizobium laguerreae TaxID=1076926 RepID=UPI001C921C2A|nr:hypothetical protein [Rhizobium laguerreae]MBY3157268.1 hypothetical protein [Rhizobium laguerreae]